MRSRLQKMGATAVIAALLAGCFAPTHLPPEDPAARDLPTPELLPLSRVVAQARAQEGTPDMAAGIEARAASLNARAARLRATSLTQAERDAMTGMQARHR